MAEKRNPTLLLSDKTYAVFKKLVQIILPAISSAYFALSSIWGFPATEKVIGSLAVITTFLGIVLGVSSRNYEVSGAAYDGKLVISPHVDPEKLLYSLELDGDPDELSKKESISFKVDSKV